jgi:hypothetical protein
MHALPFALLAASALTAGPIDPLATMDEVQVTGWSADETKFSVRAFARYDAEGAGDGDPDCPGYLDQNGKKFRGQLVLAAYDRGRRVDSWVVQDYPECTPPEKAKFTLTAAKNAFLELGIELNAKGTRLDCNKRPCDLKHGGATLVFENATKVSDDDESGMSATLKGPLRVWLKTGKDKTQLVEHQLNDSFQRMMGGRKSALIAPVELSPSGKALFVRLMVVFTSGRGGGTTVLPVGFYMWNADHLEKK